MSNMRMDEQIVVYAYCSVIKRNELSIHKNLKYLLLTERSQFEKMTQFMTPIIQNSGKGQIEKLKKKKKISGCQSQGEERSTEWMDSRGFLGE